MSTAPRLPGAAPDLRLKQAMATWQEQAMAIGAIDPVVTELVRLRAARHHDCHT